LTFHISDKSQAKQTTGYIPSLTGWVFPVVPVFWQLTALKNAIYLYSLINSSLKRAKIRKTLPYKSVYSGFCVQKISSILS
jgi:hypothetical protein